MAALDSAMDQVLLHRTAHGRIVKREAGDAAHDFAGRVGGNGFDLGGGRTARIGDAELPAVDNGAGLSRDARLTAHALARMLQVGWASPVMPELVASLPIAGVDGTLRRSQSRAAAHLKTGSLRDVMAVAGYVHAASGRRYVLVAVVNHAQAGAARPVLDSLVDWAARDQP